MEHPTRRPRQAGFTLVELLVVAGLLGFVALLLSTLVARNVIDSAAASAPASPAGETSPAQRLVQLAGLAIALFGAGFWYTVERHRPGRLDSFRLGSFLVLALTYSLFFVAFGVLHANECGPWWSVGVAAALSYPLVAWHVASVTGARFAWTTALPLAALTTAIVVNGAYGGHARSFVYLGMASAVVAYLTWSHPRLLAARDAHQRRRCAEASMELDALAPEADAARFDLAAAGARLAHADPSGDAALRRWFEQRRDALERAVELFDEACGLEARMRSAQSYGERNEARASAAERFARLRSRLPRARAALQEATDRLDLLRERHRAAARRREHDAGHCVACGHANAGDARFCSRCGRATPEARACPRCAQVLLLPRHLLPSGDDDEAASTHCHACGEPHAAAG